MITEEQYAGMLMTTKSLQKQLTAMTAERDRLLEWTSVNGVQKLADERDEWKIMAETATTRADAYMEKSDELAEYKAEIETATAGAIDDVCGANERHCTCVPLLRAEVKRLTAERDTLEIKLLNATARGDTFRDMHGFQIKFR